MLLMFFGGRFLRLNFNTKSKESSSSVFLLFLLGTYSLLSESFIVMACGSFLWAPYWAAKGEYAGPEYWFSYLEQPDSATT